jgi:NADPH:quinone reductase-like Zn-dependent oxidoreductase
VAARSGADDRGAGGDEAARADRRRIDRVFALGDIAAAHRHMEDNQAIGKVVMLP